MTTATQAPSRGVRPITLDAAGVTLSALLREPEQTPPRATVVALHGAGMSAGYFDGQAHPDLSLLTLGARLGFTVLAVDRPGYGHSAGLLPEGQTLAEQARTLRAALDDFAARHATGAGLYLLAHSFGGKLALTTAADATPDRLLGLDISGCGHRYAVLPDELPEALARMHFKRSWGRLGLYPPNTFRSSTTVVAPMPVRERWAAASWPEVFAELALRIRVPIRFTFAEHELWWCHDRPALADLTGRLTSAPRVVVDRQPDAGHNISLGWAARSYHLRALGFLEECLLREPEGGA
ncbi:alpha/beta hydrolase [Streptomyces sp. NPDC002889]|uniref:alpha/beta hydrolase n=1 Tax=Streptomyces sp. NPDC002889 TaxID=3364669 RepID=UPI0036AC9A36